MIRPWRNLNGVTLRRLWTGASPVAEHLRVGVEPSLKETPEREQSDAPEERGAALVSRRWQLTKCRTELAWRSRSEAQLSRSAALVKRPIGAIGRGHGPRRAVDIVVGGRQTLGHACEMDLARQHTDGTLGHLWQPDQHRLLVDRWPVQMLRQMAQRTAGDEIGRVVVLVVIVEMVRLLPARGWLTAELAGGRGWRCLPLARSGVGGPGRGV